MRRNISIMGICAAITLLINGCAVNRPISKTSPTSNSGRSVSKKSPPVILNDVNIATKDLRGVSNSYPPNPAGEHAITRYIRAATVRTVNVNNEFGSVALEPTTVTAQIGVVATVTLSENKLTKPDREKYLKGFIVPDTITDGVYTVRVSPPANLPKNVHWMVSYIVSVPPSVTLDLTTDDGSILVRDTKTKGKVLARSGFGDITIANAGSTVDVQTNNGGVDIAEGMKRDSVRVRSKFGSITVTGPATTIDVKTGDGSVIIKEAIKAQHVTARSSIGVISLEGIGGTVDAQSNEGSVLYSGSPTTLALKSGSGTVSAEIASCGKLTDARLTSLDGSVMMQLPASASVVLNGHAGNGGIMTNGFTTPIHSSDSEHSLKVVRNGGRIPIHLSTESGPLSITIE